MNAREVSKRFNGLPLRGARQRHSLHRTTQSLVNSRHLFGQLKMCHFALERRYKGSGDLVN